jgi:hypothetical protein
MNPAKIQLSPDELLLVQHGEWILTKNAIIQKVYNLFGYLAEQINDSINTNHLPREVAATTAKISKGENYNGLPYVMLDYPRFFTKTDVFAIRTFFWWANYISITLHLKGRYKTMFAGAIQKNKEYFTESDFYISATEEEWQHDIAGRNYILLNRLDNLAVKEILLQSPFVKLTVITDLAKWNEAPAILLRQYGALLKSLED